MKLGNRLLSRLRISHGALPIRRVQQRVFAFLAVISVLLAGTAQAQAETNVVVTVKPIHSLAASVMAGVDTPYLIVKGAATPHAYALKPSDAAAIQKARIIVRVGGSFEQFLKSAIKRRNIKSKVIDLHDSTGVKTLSFRTGPTWAGDHDHNHSHDDHDFDPHIWLAPDNAIAIVKDLQSAFTKAFPQHGPVFARNADATITRIDQLSASIRKQLSATTPKPYLVYHDAYQYFERAFSLPAFGAISLGDSRSAGAKRIRRLRKTIKNNNIACIFIEPQFEPKLARSLIDGTPARIAVLDPIGADIPAGENAYFEIMKRNATSLASCLSGQ